MVFNSVEFLMFFTVVSGAYFMLAYRFRWIWLLSASYFFYGSWNAKYLILIILSTLIDYFAALMMDREEVKVKRKKYLYLSLASNIGMLFIFKYFNFFMSSLDRGFDFIGLSFDAPALKVLLPVGISFYTFQTLSYTIDVYRGTRKAEKHLGIFASYVTFFPQLVAGPIEYSTHLLPQFRQKIQFDYNRVTDGLKLMLWGFFKKIVIADRVSVVVNNVYNDVYAHGGLTLMIATVLFAFQIYCDFSAYSDIAIGSAQVLGFDLMENFKRPYYAKSISEFWRRWHISLGKWFKDYLYISLGGNRVPRVKLYRNIMVVFLVSGLWHGASWNFIVWGGLHGIYQLIELSTKTYRDKFYKMIKLTEFPTLKNFIHVVSTFMLVCFAWIFFRANTFSDALYTVKTIFTDFPSYEVMIIPSFGDILELMSSLGDTKVGLLVTIFSIGILELFHLAQRSGRVRHRLNKKHITVRWTVYITLFFYIIAFGRFGKTEFIYFQF